MREKNRGLIALVTMLGLTVVLVTTGTIVADRIYRASVRTQFLADEAARLGELAIMVPLIDSMPSWTDPSAPQWDEATSLEVPVKPQNLAMPMLTTASVRTVRVDALHDGHMIGWRLTWKDKAPDLNLETARFCDAAALQFAVGENASFMMGGPDQPVHILHWKALWQNDIENGYQDVQDLHPNYWTDLYWFASGEFPFPIPEAFEDPVSRQWFPAQVAGNPLAIWDRTQPIEELSAESYGTLTHQRQQAAIGGGAWHDGYWSLVIARPLSTQDSADFQFWPGVTGRMGIAIWEGAGGNVGGRKNYSDWIEFKVENMPDVAMGGR